MNPKGNQSRIFIGRTDAKAETPILWPPDAKNWLIGKDPDARKDWRQDEKGTTEDEMVGWHHQLNGHEFEQTPGDGEGQGNLACCTPWGSKELDRTETEQQPTSKEASGGWNRLLVSWYKPSMTEDFPGSSAIKNLPAMQEMRVWAWVRKILWGRNWQAPPIFLPGEFHGQRSLVGYSPWGCKELDMTN